MTLDPITVGTTRKEELQFAESLDAWEVKSRFDAMQHMKTSRMLNHNWGNTSKPEYRSRLVVQDTPRTGTILQDDVAATTSATLPLDIAFVVLPCRCLGWCCNSLTCLEHTQTAKLLRDNVYVEGPVTVLATRGSAGTGPVTQDKPSSRCP